MLTDFVMSHAGVLELRPNDKIYTTLRKTTHAGIRKAVVDHMGHLRRTVRKKNEELNNIEECENNLLVVNV
jgi:hypothetical protein